MQSEGRQAERCCGSERRVEGIERGKWRLWKWNELALTVAVLVLAMWNAGVSGESSSFMQSKGETSWEMLWKLFVDILDHCDGEMINAIRYTRQRSETQKQHGKLELNTGDEGKHFSGLFKLVHAVFILKWLGPIQKRDPEPKGEVKTENKGLEINGKRKECPKTCKSDWKNATYVYNHEWWRFEHLAMM